MAIESELKLRITPAQLVKLRQHELLKSYSVTRPVTRRLYNIYFDSPKLELYKSNMALRLRYDGRNWVQTLKGGGSVQAGLHNRSEWEVPVQGPALDLSLMNGREVDKKFPKELLKRLKPLFVTDFKRTTRFLRFNNAQIELCMDQGEISTEECVIPICEIELELKSGSSIQVFELALLILDNVPVELEVLSKAEQGYRLLQDIIDNPIKESSPILTKAKTLADVLKIQIWACLQHFQGNLHGSLTGHDPEFIHQMRVALRRLRVALQMAGRIRANLQLEEFEKKFRTLGLLLGRIREWDVFIAGTLLPMCESKIANKHLQELFFASEIHRDDNFREFCSTSNSYQVQRLLLKFAIWMNGAYWRNAIWQEDASLRAYEFASLRLDKLGKQFSRARSKIDYSDLARLHELRIIAKKIRYGTEFFRTFFHKDQANSYLERLGRVQDVLGQINDIEVAYRLLGILSTESSLTVDQETIDLTRGWIAHNLSCQVMTLKKAMHNLDAHTAPWRK